MAEELSMVVRCSDEMPGRLIKTGFSGGWSSFFLQAKRTPRLAGFL
jgi:hypothetical protein